MPRDKRKVISSQTNDPELRRAIRLVKAFILKAFPALIDATQDPTAPLKVNQAHSAVCALGKMLGQSPGVSKALGEQFTQTLMSHWTDAEIDKIASRPEYVAALCSMLASAIEYYTVRVVREHKP